MGQDQRTVEGYDPAAVVLGYLNFSEGAYEPAAWRGLSDLYAACEPPDAGGRVTERADTPPRVAALLAARLDELATTAAPFRDAERARTVLRLVFDDLLPAYRRFHADLLEHQPPGGLERPFFVMAAFRGVLAQGSLDGDRQRVVAATIDGLNDYVGWRPVSVLENGQLSAPYRHERVRPLPLFDAGAGTAHGRYAALVGRAIEILRAAPPALVRQADFDPAALEELAIDPRAFDFLHPAASRPNYLFGLWDPGRIDQQGAYRRMVVQQATLDGILGWPEAAAPDRDPDQDAELRFESAAVLAGVVLMASGLSGHGPGALQAGLPLAELLPRIAGYRDAFYRWLLAELPAGHRRRLEEEARRMQQPFGGVRRHINGVLAARRAAQVEHVALSGVLARLGRDAAAERMAGAVPATSARLVARITGRGVAARRALGAHDVGAALASLDASRDLLMRAVACGATIDPWNILGLSGQFPLHEPGGESLPDPRVDDLVDNLGGILEGYAAAWQQAALTGEADNARRAAAALEDLAAWWDRFATTTVSGVPHLSGSEAFASAGEVIAALERRRETAPAAPPPGFWRDEVAGFSSPRAHAQAADALLREGDLDGALGLLVHWASLLEGAAIDRSGTVWLAAAARWLSLAAAVPGPAGRQRVRRFLDLVEANTAAVFEVIETAAADQGESRRGPDAADDEQEGGDESVASAYESMVWRDSADDGVDGGMIDVNLPGNAAPGGLAELETAASFLQGVHGLLRQAVTSWCTGAQPGGDRQELDAVVGWRRSLRRQRRALVRAASLVAARDLQPPPGMGPVEFDRLRWQRDAAAERLIEAAVHAAETGWVLAARLALDRPPAPRRRSRGSLAVGRLFAALVRGDVATTAAQLDDVRQMLLGKAVLYVPLSRGGRPERIVRARSRARLLERIAACLPRLGLVADTAALVQLAKKLEARRPPGGASVSEFDRIFEAATTALVERIVESAAAAGDEAAAAERILDGLSLLVPRLLEAWLTHARQLRLSVLERVREDRAFAPVRDFVAQYGSGLFTQHLLAPSSLRGILRGGVRRFLEQLVEQEDAEPPAVEEAAAARRPVRLVEALRHGTLSWKQAASRLRLVLESVAENHAEYRDWNSTTTQSDRGECLHIFLDHLRIKAEHDRIVWTLRPVTMAHRVLARRGAAAAAAAWRGRLRDETRDTAATLVERLSRLEAHSGVRLASIGDRVRRPFGAALEQDELEALVEPAVTELAAGGPGAAGARLEEKAASFLGVASGSGVEVPEWLERLTTLVDRALERSDAGPRDRRPARPSAAGLPATIADAVGWLPIPWDVLHAALAP